MHCKRSCWKNFYCAVVAAGNLLQPFLLLALRLFWGALFVKAGSGKLMNPEQNIQFFESIHIAAPHLMTYLVGIIETLGGAMLIVGFGARLAAIPLIVIMLVAYATAHAESLNAAFTDPYVIVKEAPFNYLLTSLIVLAFGPGAFSVDALFKRCCGHDSEEGSSCCPHK